MIGKEKILLEEEDIFRLRELVKLYLTKSRYEHSVSVEEECSRLAQIFMPEEKNRLRAAALLHDITKKETLDRQLQLCGKFGIIIDNVQSDSVNLLHAVTAAEVAKRELGQFTDEGIISAVRYHTTGRAGMTDFEALLCLADYIEPGRKYESCLNLRKWLYNELECKQSLKCKRAILYLAMAECFDGTIKSLCEKGSEIHKDTIDARDWFKMKLEDHMKNGVKNEK